MIVRFARAYPAASIVGVDGSPAMLALARDRLRREGLLDRVEVRERRLPDRSTGDERYDVVLSNSLLHHLADPADLWRTVDAYAMPGAPVLVMDLCRPEHDADVDRLVQQYAAGAPPVLQHDFAASLRAAYKPDEVARQLEDAGLPFVVEQTTDRHLVVRGRR